MPTLLKRGSIAIWHETIAEEAEGYGPSVDVHINIWRDKERSERDHFDLFDIGFRIKRTAFSADHCRLVWPFLRTDENLVSDLFENMRDESTLSAIFNETLSPGELADGFHTFEASSETRVQFFEDMKCPEDERREVVEIGTGDDRVSVITLTDAFFGRLRGPSWETTIFDSESKYLRIRVTVSFPRCDRRTGPS